MSLHCSTCLHWQYVYDTGLQKFGFCNNDHVIDSIRVPQETETGIFTEACFGCVWHESHNKCVREVKVPWDAIFIDVAYAKAVLKRFMENE